jgi:hypothetical protein
MFDVLKKQLRAHAPPAEWLERVIPLGPTREERNIRFALTDGVGIGLGLAAAPFVPVLLARLGADNFAIGLWTAMPALSRLLFGILAGRFLATRPNLVPWYSTSRLLVFSMYGLIGLVPLLFPNYAVQAILGVGLLKTLPYAVLAVGMTVVMAEVAGERGRYYLMSRRWAIAGVATALAVGIGTIALDLVAFPLNYTILFVGMASGGLISFYFSRQIELPPNKTAAARSASPRAATWRERLGGLTTHPVFARFAGCHFIFRFGLAGFAPLIPLYYVRTLDATDGEIGVIVTVSNVIPIFAYFLWARVARTRSARFMLLLTTVGVTLQPLLLPFGDSIRWAILIALVVSLFQAGFDLAIFDALATSLPIDQKPLFAGIYHTTLNLAMFLGPLTLTVLSEQIGINNALWFAGGICLAGIASFFLWYERPQTRSG